MAEVKLLKVAFLETHPLDPHNNGFIAVKGSEVFPRSPSVNSDSDHKVTEVGELRIYR